MTGTFLIVDQEVFVTDVVDDWRKGNIRLCLMNSVSGARRDVLEISHPKVLRRTNRCDMHVSLCMDRTEFQIDSRHSGRRSVIIGQIPEPVEF